MFELLESSATQIDFINEVVDQEDFNILNYRNYYNGGGVAIGDINNDSLPDIYFTANMAGNRLYLNKGNFLFEEITGSAKVAGSKAWSTGVTMVDINSDGWLDIYVCNSGDVNGNDRENELFINQGDNTFIESAAIWGLDDRGFSTQSIFFDYDLDGDLDCFILNNSFRSPDRIDLYQKSRSEISQEGGDRLMRNDGTHFTNVTIEAGIFSSDIGEVSTIIPH
ncbi:MAG: VCBS repeat-containing protein [Bacteroidota bacterium]